jgi:signal transduction histidine kinase
MPLTSTPTETAVATTEPDPQAMLESLRADYRELVGRLERNQHEFVHLARSVYRLQEDERRRLARELHDGVGQNLTALKHQLSMLIDALPEAADESRRRAGLALATCVQTLEDTRQMSRLLRPQILDDLGLSAALRWLARSVGDAAGIDCQLHMGNLPELDPELQTVVFRVVQEALSNVVRHAGASRVAVRLEGRADLLRIEVEDDGCGLDADLASRGIGSGLGGMRERLRLFGGMLAIERGADGGCRLRIALPMDAAG